MAVDLKRPDRPSSDRAEGAIERVTIKPSANGGYAVECERRPPERKSSKGYEPTPYRPPTTYTFESFESMVQHLESLFGAAGSEEAAEMHGGMRGGKTDMMAGGMADDGHEY